MACLFCGKEIGPIRLLRDREFCSPKHRKEYKDRLQKVLVRVGEPETVPAQISSFVDPVRAATGSRTRSLAAFDFSTSEHRTRFPQSWPLAIPEAGRSVFAHLSLTALDVSAAPVRIAPADAVPYFSKSAVADTLPAPETQLGTLVLRSAEGELLSPPMAVEHRSPSAEPHPIPNSSAIAPQSAAPLALPAIAIPPAHCEELTLAGEEETEAPEAFEGPVPPPAAWMPMAQPLPLAGPVQPSLAGSLPIAASLRLPESLPLESAQPPVATDAPPDLCETWMPVPTLNAAQASALPTLFGAFPVAATMSLPAALSAAPPAPKPEICAQPVTNLAPQAVLAASRPSGPVLISIPLRCATPELAGLDIDRAALPVGNGRSAPIPECEPAARLVQPAALCQPVAFAGSSLRLAPFALQPVHDLVQPEAAEAPAARAPERVVATAPPLPAAPKTPALAPVEATPAAARSSQPVTSAPSLRFPKLEEKQAIAQTPSVSGGFDTPSLEAVPYGDLLTVEYTSQRGPESPLVKLEWTSRTLPVSLPRFAVRPVFDRVEEDVAPKKPESKTPAFAEVFSMPDAAAFTRSRAARHAITAIAASVTVAIALWFGSHAGRFVINREAADEIAAAARARANSGTLAADAEPAQAAPSPLTSPVAWVRTNAAKRAAVQYTDSFKEGMEAWGAKAKAMAPGWSRNADGYVRPGQLALFQPTLKFTDYKMEFFGQIENKSMSWVVRGKDPNNYYAMKFNVVEPGLRPVLSMVHYPVIDGKPGHKVETPLSAMVHNDTPYHVAVQVKGNRFTASIEGQEVDEWTDDSLLAGGVGFFSEAGARARIYWMKVSKNDDWFGRICGYLSGGADAQPRDTAWLERSLPQAPAPERPLPPPVADAFWNSEPAGMGFGRLQRGRTSFKGESEKWST